MDTQQSLLVKAHFDASQALTQVRTLSKAIRDQRTALKGSAAAAAELAREQGRMGRGMRSVRGVAQQAGYQIADLAIVLQQGQDGFKAMAIQGGQFVGALGPMGAALGGILTVGGLVLSIFKDMRAEGGEIPAMAEKILDAFTYLGAYIKAVLLPNFKAFIADVQWAWENLAIFRQLVISFAAALGVTLIPKIYALSKALIALTMSNPFTALAMAAITGAVLIAANWDKVKVFFEYGLPAAILLAKAGWYAFVEAIVRGAKVAIEKLSSIIEAGINPLIRGMNAVREFAGFTEMFDEIEVGADVIANLNTKILELDSSQRKAYLDGRIALDTYNEKMAEVNESRDEAIKKQLELTNTIEEGNKKGAASTNKLKEATEELTFAQEVAQSALEQGIGGFVDELAKADRDWGEFVKKFLIDIGKMILKQTIFNLLSQALGGPGSGANATSIAKILFPNAQGNAFSNGNVVPFASGGVVNGPTIFPMNSGTGLMGEAGPEAIVPLQRDGSGNLGVGAVAPQVIVNNYSGQEVSVSQNQQLIEIAVGKSRQAVAGDFSQSMASGQGSYARAMESSYSARRKAT